MGCREYELAKTIDAIPVADLLAFKAKLQEDKAEAERSGHYCECDGSSCMHEGEEFAYREAIEALDLLLRVKTVGVIVVTRK